MSVALNYLMILLPLRQSPSLVNCISMCLCAAGTVAAHRVNGAGTGFSVKLNGKDRGRMGAPLQNGYQR